MLLLLLEVILEADVVELGRGLGAVDVVLAADLEAGPGVLIVKGALEAVEACEHADLHSRSSRLHQARPQDGDLRLTGLLEST